MIYSEQYKEHIEYTFAAFCRVVLRNAGYQRIPRFWAEAKMGSIT